MAATGKNGRRHPVGKAMTSPPVQSVKSSSPPGWSTPTEALRLIRHRPHLVRTVSVALVVGTILFSINQLDVVMGGNATTGTWVKSISTYLVPFLVANYGLLTATRLPRDTTGPGSTR
jgi:hypothetical protein